MKTQKRTRAGTASAAAGTTGLLSPSESRLRKLSLAALSYGDSRIAMPCIMFEISDQQLL